MYHDTPLHAGTLLKRYKRFLADIRLDSGELITAHCPNSGSMKGYKQEGLKVWVSHSENPKRKLAYTWEIVEDGESEKIIVHAAKANQLVKEAIENGRIDELRGYDDIRTEVKYGSQNSRIDLLLEKGDERCYVEVKSVTLKEGDVLMFPDAVTSRGQKHLQELMEMRAQGDRAVIFFAVLREGGRGFAPARHIDPDYAELLDEAISKGVEAVIYQVDFAGNTIRLKRPLGMLGL